MVEADFSEVMRLAADLDKAADNAGKFIRKAVQVTAHKVKYSAQAKVKGREMLGQAAVAITYELKGFQGFGATVLEAEIGYDKGGYGGVGKLGNLIEFGAPAAREVVLSRTRGGGVAWVPKPGGRVKPLAPGMELQRSLHENEDDFLTGIERALDDAMREVGL